MMRSLKRKNIVSMAKRYQVRLVEVYNTVLKDEKLN
jgi:hypothetical protein